MRKRRQGDAPPAQWVALLAQGPGCTSVEGGLQRKGLDGAPGRACGRGSAIDRVKARVAQEVRFSPCWETGDPGPSWPPSSCPKKVPGGGGAAAPSKAVNWAVGGSPIPVVTLPLPQAASRWYLASSRSTATWRGTWMYSVGCWYLPLNHWADELVWSRYPSESPLEPDPQKKWTPARTVSGLASR